MPSKVPRVEQLPTGCCSSTHVAPSTKISHPGTQPERDGSGPRPTRSAQPVSVSLDSGLSSECTTDTFTGTLDIPDRSHQQLLLGWSQEVVRHLVQGKSVAVLVEMRCAQTGATRQHWGGALLDEHVELNSALAAATSDAVSGIYRLSAAPCPLSTPEPPLGATKLASGPTPTGSQVEAALSENLAEASPSTGDTCAGISAPSGDSVQGGGRTTSFSLPKAPGEAECTATTAEATSAESRIQLRSVLVVDDDHINTKVLSRQLRRAGLEVLVGKDGEDVVNLCISLRQRYDVLLIDEFMSRMSGSTATRLLRKFERQHGLPPTPVIITSANSSDVDMKRYHAAGADGLIAKPIYIREIAGAIRKYFDLTQTIPSYRRHGLPNNHSWAASDHSDMVASCGTCVDNEVFHGSLEIDGFLQIFGCLKDGQKLDRL